MELVCINNQMKQCSICGICSHVLNELQSLLYSLFKSEVMKAEASNFFGGIHYCLWHVAMTPHFVGMLLWLLLDVGVIVWGYVCCWERVRYSWQVALFIDDSRFSLCQAAILDGLYVSVVALYKHAKFFFIVTVHCNLNS